MARRCARLAVPKNWRSAFKRAVTTFRRVKSKLGWNSFYWRSGPARRDPVALRAPYVRAIFPACGRQACLVKVGQGNTGTREGSRQGALRANGYKNIEEFLPATAGRPEAAE